MVESARKQSPPPIFDPVPSQVDFPAQERKTLELWEQTAAYELSVQSRPEANPFIFYDGPPFASGLPHYGHLLVSIVKDVVARYWTMRGYRVERRFGWDCHGLPVENEAEQQLGLRSRKDILEYGVPRFNDYCRSLVLRYTAEWEQLVRRVGRWVDWDNQYLTMDPEFMESVWWVFKRLWDLGLVYEGYKSLAYCPRCATALSNFEVNQGYRDTQDPSITIRFRVKEAENTSILAWTTTPWTLPANMALAIATDCEYVRVQLHDGERLILARERLDAVFRQREDEIAAVEGQPAEALLGLRYEPLFDCFAGLANEGAFRVVAADFVSTDDGTGVVHIAPGFGEDDYQLGLREGLPAVCPIDEDCRFTGAVPDYAGRFVKDADTDIIRHLRRRGQLFGESSLVHSYPFCWRCESPLIYRAISSWFVGVEGIKDSMLGANEQIWWIPEHIRGGRFGKWLQGARDWCISRDRYWGTPLPVWRNDETGEAVCVGSVEELERLSGRTVTDLHKQFVDGIEIPAPSGNGVLKRVPAVLDCWFESGSMPYAQNHYPFENREYFEQNFPADFITESLDQTRGWFYTLTILAAALFDKPAYRNCIVTGMLLAEDGRKMSKRLKNYPEPTEMLDLYGADALRLYLLNSPALKAEEMRLTETGIRQSLRDVIIPLWNAYSFFVTYAGVDRWSPAEARDPGVANLLDRWILSELQTLVHDINAEMEAYRLYRTVPAMVAFVEKLTNWYIRRSRRRFWKSEEDDDKASAYATLYRVLVTFVKSLAPVLPFATEKIYQNLVRSWDPEAPLSVHLCDMPEADEEMRDSGLEQQMALAARAVTLGRSLRSRHEIRIRQPLGRVLLLPPDESGAEKLADLADLVADELNVKEVVFVEDEAEISEVSCKANYRALGPRFGKRVKEVAAFIEKLTRAEVARLETGERMPVAGGTIGSDDVQLTRREKEGVVVAVDGNLCVGLDVNLDKELIREGTAREVVNRVQNLRKTAGLEVSDRIRLWIAGSRPVVSASRHHRNYIAAETLATEIRLDELPGEVLLRKESDIDGETVTFAIDRA